MKRIFPIIFLQMLSYSGLAQDKDSVVMLPEVVVTAQGLINEQIDRSFAARFPESYDIVWRKLNKDYLIKFIEIDIHKNFFYTTIALEHRKKS